MMGRSHLTAGVMTSLAGVYQFLQGTGQAVDVGTVLLATAVGAFASLLPDIDSEGGSLLHSKVRYQGRSLIRPLVRGLFGVGKKGNPVRVVGELLAWLLHGGERGVRELLAGLIRGVGRSLTHRGFTHTLGCLGLCLLGFVAINELLPTPIPPVYGVAFGVGYASHLLTDSFTRSGVALLWPVCKRPFHALPPAYRLKTDSTQGVSLGELLVLGVLGLVCLLAFALPTLPYLVGVALLVLGLYGWGSRR